MGLAFVSFVLPFLFSIYTPPPQVEYATYAHWPVTDLSIVTLACTCPDIMYMNHPCICNQSDLRHHILARIGNWEWSLMVTSESSTELGKTGFTIVKKFHSKFYCNWQRQEKNFAKQSRSWNLSAHSQSCGSTGKISSNWSGTTTLHLPLLLLLCNVFAFTHTLRKKGKRLISSINSSHYFAKVHMNIVKKEKLFVVFKQFPIH